VADGNIIVDKSRTFAIRIIRLYKLLRLRKVEYDLCRQLLRSGTSIGANVKEAVRGQSKPDFYAKMSIALKEASETEYWLDIMYASKELEQKEYESINKDCQEILRLLTAICKSQKK